MYYWSFVVSLLSTPEVSCYVHDVGVQSFCNLEDFVYEVFSPHVTGIHHEETGSSKYSEAGGSH